MARKKREESPPAGAPLWMTTYGDMVTLLLCFFVLLFSFSEIDVQKFEAIISSFNGSIGILDSGKTVEPSPNISEAMKEDQITNQLEEWEDFKKLQELIEQYLADKGLNTDVLVSLETRGLVLRFQDNVLFDSGKADLKDTSKEILIYLAEFLAAEEFKGKHIRIEGHTDTDPLRPNSKFETNWELSVSRAANVVRYLIEEIELEPARFSASGYGEYHPVTTNDTMENKAKNRRVDIVILRSEDEISLP
ncbi:OmpA/MotB family protein [Alkaliphilus hydrothermalis]|uniref:Chemotaxis protein MotB n=1 Tax=Alkaliphilus hydrothermalis TaxID=1482730 RepID=A0ABS2NL58_9FIRM|nr:flagellar motor protein MotB [Alkaliphilus hydrothermalis]MBM7613666.1 chemotaxis protein MotB [Alkaliphilus hydrothermalis]